MSQSYQEREKESRAQMKKPFLYFTLTVCPECGGYPIKIAFLKHKKGTGMEPIDCNFIVTTDLPRCKCFTGNITE